jgi:hypothetical protein
LIIRTSALSRSASAASPFCLFLQRVFAACARHVRVEGSRLAMLRV